MPDGMRADPEVFDIFRWAEVGRMPHLHALMQRGTYGWSIPTFPSHTPTNFATLLTGAPPAVHGVADGPMRVEGSPLARPSVGGFSSSARRVPAAWSLLEDTGRKVVVMSMPGSTPPEMANGVTVRGRWGGWGHSCRHPRRGWEPSPHASFGGPGSCPSRESLAIAILSQ